MNYSLAINMAMTIDGKVMRPDGKWYGLSSRNDKKKMDDYRSEAEILLLGKNSIINDNPVIHLRYVEKPGPIPVVLLRKGNISRERHLFSSEKKPILYCTPENFDEVFERHKDHSEIICSETENLDPKFIISDLQNRGYSKFLLEGGPTLNYAFFSLDLVTRIHLTIVPFLIGGSSAYNITFGDSHFPGFDKRKWKLENCEKLENEVFLTYSRTSVN